MAEAPPSTPPDTSAPDASVEIHVAPSPHLSDTTLTTRRMMVDVLIGLIPVLLMALFIFRWYAAVQVSLCVLGCLAAEVVFSWMRGKRIPIGDYSAAVTGVILGLSLPWNAPWYIAVIGSFSAVGLGKVVFGGLGCNIFNPAMVGRAFVMLSFAADMGSSAYQSAEAQLDVLTRATPLSDAKRIATELAAEKISVDEAGSQLEKAGDITDLLVGQVNGSLGEISALALLLGGIYLCIRRVASWEIPAGVILATGLFAAVAHWAGLTPFTATQHLASGALLLGAFFIATDPVTSPLTAPGKFIFGLGIGLLVVVIRFFSGYPEGVMFAVLVMNATVPLINRWTIPRPFGGPAPQTA